MSSSSRLDVLRERNKDLLKQLKEQSEKLELLRGYFRSREEDGDGEAEAEARSRSEEVVVTRSDGERGPTRAALSEQTTLKFADLCDNKTGTECSVSTPPVTSKCERTTQHTDSPPDSDDRLRVQETSPHGLKSCLAKNNKEQREMQRRVTFQSHDCEEPAPDCQVPATDRHHLQPLLGYDWIAGVLDSEDTVTQCSDEFFNDLHVFRSLHKDECVHSSTADSLNRFSEENQSGLDLLTDKDDPQAHTDTHKCTFSYRINSRLFPAPLHSRECCPVCKKHKSSHPHTTADPALIRVSIPRSTVLPPHKYKAHRRCSFDPTDSLGLPSHCLSGWSHTAQSTVPPPSSLDMRSSLNTKSSAQVIEDASTPQMSADQIANVSKLPRHNFRHFSPKRKKIGNTSYQVC